MAYLMLYGNGWTQRWGVPAGTEPRVRDEILRVGTDATGSLTVLDPGSEAEATLVVAWALVAAAVVLEGLGPVGADDTSGQYA